MPNADAVQEAKTAWESPPVKPLDEAVWQAWKEKRRAQDRNVRDKQSFQVLKKALTWGSIIALLAVVGFWSERTPYDIVIRCFVAAGAIGLMANAIHNRHYSIAVVFAGLAVLYNPVTPLFAFAGNWQRVLVVLSAVPFVASLTRRDLKGAYIG